MAANVSAKALAAQAKEAEDRFRNGPREAAAPMIRRVRDAIGDVLRAIG